MARKDHANLDRIDRNILATLAEEGRIRPRVHAEFPLADWRAAFELLANREVVGKAVIRPGLG